MNCHMHYKREANFLCDVCRQPICEDCMRTLGGICIFCAEKTKTDIKRNFILTIISSCLLAIIGFVFALGFVSDATRSPKIELILIVVLSTILMFFAPFGWNSLSRLTSSIFLILPLAGWLIYFLVKGCLSLMIGWLVAIPKFIRMKKNLDYAKKLDANIKIINGQY